MPGLLLPKQNQGIRVTVKGFITAQKRPHKAAFIGRKLYYIESKS